LTFVSQPRVPPWALPKMSSACSKPLSSTEKLLEHLFSNRQYPKLQWRRCPGSQGEPEFDMVASDDKGDG
jgi:hypothetical protein